MRSTIAACCRNEKNNRHKRKSNRYSRYFRPSISFKKINLKAYFFYTFRNLRVYLLLLVFKTTDVRADGRKMPSTFPWTRELSVRNTLNMICRSLLWYFFSVCRVNECRSRRSPVPLGPYLFSRVSVSFNGGGGGTHTFAALKTGGSTMLKISKKKPI